MRLPTIDQHGTLIGQWIDRVVDNELRIGALDLEQARGNADGRDAPASSPCREAQPVQTLHARCAMRSTSAPLSGMWRLATGHAPKIDRAATIALGLSQPAGLMPILCLQSTTIRESAACGSGCNAAARSTVSMPFKWRRSTVRLTPAAQSAASLIAVSKAFASKAGMLWIRPSP